MCKYEHLDLALRECKNAGATWTIEIPKSNAIKIWITLNNQTKLLVAAKTPSCPFAHKHIRGDARRIIREMQGNLISINK